MVTRRAGRICAVQAQRHSIPPRCTDHRVQGRVSPITGAHRRPDRIIQPAKPTRNVSRKSSSAISGFRSLCGHEQRSSLSRRTQRTSLWNLSPGGLSRFFQENSGIRPHYSYGASDPEPVLWAERSRSGRIFQAVFRVPLRLYRGKNRPVTARRMPARSVFASPPGTSPAAAINPATSLLWPCPTSSTRAPPAASSRVASGMIAR
jgi:hypothetical protein